MSFIKNLQKNINAVTEGYFANWTPDMPISVGDYGDISGYRFTRDGNVSRHLNNIDIDEQQLDTATFEKKYGLSIKNLGKVEESTAIEKTRLRLEFGYDGSFLYHLKDLTNIQFKERQDAFRKLGALILSGTIIWRDDYVLVTEVKQANKALILVADSAKAEMEIECSLEEPVINFARAIGAISYSLDSNRIIRYEIKQNASILFRVVQFTEVPPDGGPKTPISRLMARIREKLSNNLPRPESIYLREYVESEDEAIGEFMLPNSEIIKLSQKFVDIGSFLEISERETILDSDTIIERVPVNQRQIQRH